MERFSCWKLSEEKNLNSYIESLRGLVDTTVEIKWEDDPLRNILYKLYDNEEDIFVKKKFEYNGDIEYICFGVKLERATRESNWYQSKDILKPRSERTKIIDSKILIYGQDTDINIIIFSTDKSASVIINTIFSNRTIWGKRERKHTSINDDMFYWMFKRFKSYPEEPLSANSDLCITGLEGYLAKTREDRNVFRGVGNRIGAMIGTLAFLLSDSELRSLKPELQHNDSTFKIEMTSNNSYTILDGGYDGELNYKYKGLEIEKINNIIIYIDLYIIPKIIEAYNINVNMDLWSKQFKLDFLKDIGVEIAERVAKEVAKLKKEIEELDDCEEIQDGKAMDYEMSDEEMMKDLE